MSPCLVGVRLVQFGAFACLVTVALAPAGIVQPHVLVLAAVGGAVGAGGVCLG